MLRMPTFHRTITSVLCLSLLYLIVRAAAHAASPRWQLVIADLAISRKVNFYRRLRLSSFHIHFTRLSSRCALICPQDGACFTVTHCRRLT